MSELASSTSSEKGSRRKRNRQGLKRKDTPTTAVSLPRERLLSISLKEFDEWVENLKLSRPLTEDEQNDIRAQRRKVKNRECAQVSGVC